MVVAELDVGMVPLSEVIVVERLEVEAVLLVEVVSAIADFVQLPVITANGFQDGQR